MCGIFALFQSLGIPVSSYNDLSKNEWYQNFMKMKNRGPDETKILFGSKNLSGFQLEHNDQYIYESILGFHRLSIHGVSTLSGQPFVRNNWGNYKQIALIANAEIYNFKELKPKFIEDHEPYETESDCEILLHVKKHNDFKNNPIDFMNQFSLECAGILYTLNENNEEEIWVFRDPLGVRSFFWGYEKSNNDNTFSKLCFSSELKGIPNEFKNIEMIPSGSIYTFSRKENEKDWSLSQKLSYYNPPWKTIRDFSLGEYPYILDETPSEEWLETMKNLFIHAVKERLSSDRPIGCLLSGGLDSSLVSSIVQREGKKQNPNFCIQTFSIGLPGSPDLQYAKEVAEFIGSNHTEFIITEEELLSYVEETIYSIESLCVTSIRASTANYLISKKINENTDIAVLFCGDVSDEVFGSYRGCQKAPTDEDFFRVNVQLLEELPYYDLLRSDKSISANCLEGRVPFADKKFIDHVMSANPKWKMFNDQYMEKYLLRKVFEKDEYLPSSVLWRRKEAFSDGISTQERSWYKILQEHAEKKLKEKYSDKTLEQYEWDLILRKPYNQESLYYRLVFDKYYPEKYKLFNKHWRQPFTTVLDPSARCLDFYVPS